MEEVAEKEVQGELEEVTDELELPLVTKNTDLNELDMWDLPKSQLSKNF
jgi:hypothetical protein